MRVCIETGPSKSECEDCEHLEECISNPIYMKQCQKGKYAHLVAEGACLMVKV